MVFDPATASSFVARSDAIDPGRRRLLLGAPVLAGALAAAGPAQAQPGSRWSAAWGCAPAGPASNAPLSFADQTLRLIVRASIGGNRVRIKLSNEMGSGTLHIGRATVALRAGGATIVNGSSRALTFSGRSSITIPAGAPALSDPLAFPVAQFADLAISLYLPGSVQASTVHPAAYQANYASTAGDHCVTPSLPQQRAFSSWPFLTEIEVDGAIPVLVAVGDSLTDGAGSSSNTNRRWTDFLARRVQAELGNGQLAVINRGINGNRLLMDTATTLQSGHDALQRFDRDVLATGNTRALAFLIGINDICYSPSSNPIAPEELFSGYLQLAERARLHGISVLGMTLPPFANFVYFTPAREHVRQTVNAWMRSAQPFDTLVDADLALRDPDSPLALRPGFDSGDHLHPNDAGYQALAAAVPLPVLAALGRHIV